jgi:phosphatidylglycerophosphatase A
MNWTMNKAKWTSLLATFFGAGLSPKMPGTVGTLAAIPLWYLFYLTGPIPYMVLTFLFVIFAIFISEDYEKDLPTHDRPEIVIDEVAGFLITMTWMSPSLKYIMLGFVLFRILDIWKPQPIRTLNDKVKGGFGVVIDDVAAGIVANIILQFLTQSGYL